jgi:hypothetical protein
MDEELSDRLPTSHDFLGWLMAARKAGYQGVNLDGLDNLADYLASQVRMHTLDGGEK